MPAPIKVFDDIRTNVLKGRSQFWKDLALPFFGFNREGAAISQGLIDDFWCQGMLVNLAAAYDCVKAFSETDQTEYLKALEAPILIVHGDDDQIVPIDDATRKSTERDPQGLPRRIPRYPRRLPAPAEPGHPRLHTKLTPAPAECTEQDEPENDRLQLRLLLFVKAEARERERPTGDR